MAWKPEKVLAPMLAQHTKGARFQPFQHFQHNFTLCPLWILLGSSAAYLPWHPRTLYTAVEPLLCCGALTAI